MKKVLKVIRIILLAIIVALLIIWKLLSSRPNVPENYQQTVKTGGEIEQKYMADGSYAVSVHEDKTLQNFIKFTVYYPTELESTDRTYPVIVLCNGTGVPLSKYSAVAKHYASWGFIVIGTEETYSWNAFGAEMCLRYLERWNENARIGDADSIFYQKVDFSNVGVVGHSQGGVGVMNAITCTEHQTVYKTAVALSPTNKELAASLMWDYDATLIDIPFLLVSGAGGGDDWVVTGEQLDAIYDDIPGTHKVKMRRENTPHGEVLYSVDGYVTAWLMWHLQGDEEAARAFIGETPEITVNPLYQDQRISLSE